MEGRKKFKSDFWNDIYHSYKIKIMNSKCLHKSIINFFVIFIDDGMLVSITLP